MKKFILAILLLFSLTASAQFYDEYGNLLVVINDTTAIKVVNTDTLRFGLTNTTDTLRFFLTDTALVKLVPDSLVIYGTHPQDVNTHIYVDTVSYKDTLSAGTTSVTYSFGRQYPRLELSVKYDSTSVANDTLRLYNIGNRGDTTDIYVLDSAGNRQNYIVNSGDCKFKVWRVDMYCPENVMILYSDAEIYTTKFIIIPKAIKY